LWQNLRLKLQPDRVPVHVAQRAADALVPGALPVPAARAGLQGLDGGGARAAGGQQAPELRRAHRADQRGQHGQQRAGPEEPVLPLHRPAGPAAPGAPADGVAQRGLLWRPAGPRQRRQHAQRAVHHGRRRGSGPVRGQRQPAGRFVAPAGRLQRDGHVIHWWRRWCWLLVWLHDEPADGVGHAGAHFERHQAARRPAVDGWVRFLPVIVVGTFLCTAYSSRMSFTVLWMCTKNFVGFQGKYADFGSFQGLH